LNNTLHIISFDIPYPANYGGVIDVFHKLRLLHKSGTDIILHCFEYGREQSEELKSLCKEVYYYPRNMSTMNFLSFKPFIVKSRISENLISRLLKDDFPILFEGLHSCGIIDDERIKNRKKIYRESNIEHQYYFHLAKAEKNPIKLIYFLTESIRLRFFQKKLKHADLMLVVSQSDTAYLKKHFPAKKVCYLPSFHENDDVISLSGHGEYALYHGNLAVAENDRAAKFLIQNVFSEIKTPLIIAGLNPGNSLKKLCQKYDHIKLEANIPFERMLYLMQNAQLHILITFQATGLKLKLLNTLYQGRFCLANTAMLQGTGLGEACIITDSPEEIKQQIQEYFQKDFSIAELQQRRRILSEAYDNSTKCQKLIDLVLSVKTTKGHHLQ